MDRLRHRNLMAWEIFVVLHALVHVKPSGRRLETGQNAVDIIGPAFAPEELQALAAGFDDHRQIGRRRAVVRHAGRLNVREG